MRGQTLLGVPSAQEKSPTVGRKEETRTEDYERISQTRKVEGDTSVFRGELERGNFQGQPDYKTVRLTT